MCVWPQDDLRAKAKNGFKDLLKECKEITIHSQYGQIQGRLTSDPRYDAVSSSRSREDYFRSYVQNTSETPL